VIQFFQYAYQLHPAASLNAISGMNPRDGVLFKMQWPDQKIGYADFFPWPELGDQSIQFHLRELSRGHISFLLEQTIWLARKDAMLRSQNKNALTGLNRIKNHLLVNDFRQVTDANLRDARSSGFTTMKVKVGRDWKAEVEWLNKMLKLHSFICRLDFNSRGDLATLDRMYSSLSPGIKQKIEFVEDPFPWSPTSWADAASFVPLALDQEFKNVDWQSLGGACPFNVLVIKPARQDVEDAIRIATTKKLKMVVTSSMDHPVGIAHAVRVAAEIKAKYPNQLLECGCLTHRVYKPNEFFTKMIIQGPYLTQISGTGVGFDNILEKLDWQPITMSI
jgi:o-succinylbenzoate synthase